VLTLPATTFRNKRQSFMSHHSDLSGGGEEYLIPLAFDPTPPAESPDLSNQVTPKIVEEKPREYLSHRSAPSQGQQPAATKSNTSSPHIAYQEKGRQPADFRRNQRDGSGSRSGSAMDSPYVGSEQNFGQSDESPRLSQVARSERLSTDKFKLQDAPKVRRLAGSARSSKSGASTPRAEGGMAESTEQLPAARTPNVQETGTLSDHDLSSPPFSHDSSPHQDSGSDSPKPAPHPATTLLQNLPKRGDSLDNAKRTQKVQRKELNAPYTFTDVLNGSTPSSQPTDPARVNGGKVISRPLGSPESKSIFDPQDGLLDQAGVGGGAGKSTTESFTDPRAPPPPPPGGDHARSRNESISTLQSETPRMPEGQKSPGLPRYSGGGEFSMDDDMARILGGEEPPSHESFLRRVSNSVRHGRSYSDKTGRLSRDRWPRSPAMPTSSIGQEISSPSSASPENRDELAWFKNELRRERQKAIDREKKIAELEGQLDSAANIKQVNSELKEKRSTMVVLDAQKEIVLRELEILTDHIAATKSSGEPFDVAKMSNAVLRDFAESLQQLKESFAPQIEESIQQRNGLMDEIAHLTQMKDKSFMEFEQLSSKNAQLAELNNQLVHQIQGLYKANSGAPAEPARPPMNGLGIYSHHKDKSNISIDSREARTLASDMSVADSGTTLQAGEAEPVTVLQGPQMVNIRKGQPKKFDWRKGQKVAKGVTKGLKGAFSSTQQSYSRELQFAETGAYGSSPLGQEYAALPRPNQEPVKQGGFGFFGNQKMAPKSNGLYATQVNASTRSLSLDASSRTEILGHPAEDVLT